MTAPTPDTLDILHEDAQVIAVNKPVGVAAIPERAGDRDCLRARLEDRLQGPVWVVHRLDKDVSGVILFARDADTHRELNRLFSQRLVSKQYLALVHGHVIGQSGILRQPLREFGSGRVGVDHERGKPAVTRYRVVKTFDRHYTLLEVSPETGRRHQIRAHLYAMGHPIVGDTRYGDRAAQAGFARLMLHAASVSFARPDAPALRVDAPTPPAFDAQMRSLPVPNS